MRTDGGDLIDLGVGAPDVATSTAAKLAAIEAICDDRTTYTAAAGIEPLREAIAYKLAIHNGLQVDRDQVLVSPGAKMAVLCALSAVLASGDEVVVLAPHYAGYPRLIEIAGGRPILINARRDAAWKVAPEQLTAAITPRTRAVILNVPGNPTGVMYTAAELKALVDVVLEHPTALLVSDELYEHFTYELPHVSVATLTTTHPERVLTINGVSKTYGMTGWRIGYLAGPHEVVRAATARQQAMCNCASSISQWAAIGALSEPIHALQARASIQRTRRDRSLKWLADLPCKVSAPTGGIYLFADWSAVIGRGTPGGGVLGSVDDFLEHLRDGYGLRLSGGAKFGDRNSARLTFAVADQLLGEGIERLSAACAALT